MSGWPAGPERWSPAQRHMTITIERQILRIFLCGIFLVVMIGLVSVWLQVEANRAQYRVVQDQRIITALQAVLQSEVDAESSQRGFVITGEGTYLVPYDRALLAVESNLARLSALLSTSPQNMAALDNLHDASSFKLHEMAATIKLRQTSGFAAAQEAVADNAGTAALNEIRAIAARLNATYAAKLDDEAVQAAARLRWAYLFVVAFGLCVTALLVWAYLQIRGDLHSRRELSSSLVHEASHDPLTNMPNRRFFYDWLQFALDQAARDRSQAAILFLNLDGFKAVNKFFGYERGNQLLQVVARRLKEAARPGDVFARIGGDEFAFLIPILSDPADPAGLAQKLVETLALPFKENESLPTGASIGIAVFPADGETPDLLLAAADAAMHRAKAEGGNRYTFFFDAGNVSQSRELRIRADLFQCVEQKQLNVHYQPVVDETGCIRSLEALVRWDHPELGRIAPGDFIPLAERSGAITKIDRYVRQTVIRQCALWQRMGMGLPVAVNMSALEFTGAGLIETMLSDLQMYRLPPRYLTLELVETVLLKPDTQQTMQQLHDAGLNVVLDDFGTGFSSLSYLLNFPVSGVKIDRSFVVGLPDHEDSRRVVAVILQMAATLELDVVAEGVETAAQSEWLIQQGCTRFQGYFFGRPMEASAMEARLLEQQAATV